MIENSEQKKILDIMEAERRLKLGRDLAKANNIFIGIEMVSLFAVWVLTDYRHYQFFLFAILIMPFGVLSTLQPIFEIKKRSTLWGTLFSIYAITLVIVMPLIVPEALLGSVIAYALMFQMVGLLTGARQLFAAIFLSLLGFITNELAFAGIWLSPLFPHLSEPVHLILTLSLGILSMSATGVIFYLTISGQEKLYRQAQLAKLESDQAKAIAEEASRAKSVFLANTSHELRTPLNAILGFSQIMARDSSLNSTHRASIEIINRNGEHLLGLINNVLDMAKIESGRIHLQERSFDLYKMIETIADMFRLRANSKGLNLRVEYAPDVPIYVQMDDGKLRQVLMNLLSNAIKFTVTGGIVLRIAQSKSTDFLHFEVEDTGPGILAEEFAALFEPFSQTTSGRQAGEGTGLGLPISRQFVRLMGGDLTLRSEPGSGSMFSFDVLFHHSPITEIHQPAQTRPHVIGLAAGQPDYRLLIVEDQPDSRLLLVKLLDMVGLQVQIASNGQDAVSIWQNWRPHLIWMDVHLPLMNGLEAIQKIKSMPGNEQTIIIALSASSFSDEREQMMSVGSNDFIRKPYREDEIFDALERHLKLRFIYENEAQAQGQLPILLDFSALSDEWQSQLRDAALEADAEKIHQLSQQIKQTHPAIAEEIIRLCTNFAYNAILAMIFPANDSTS